MRGRLIGKPVGAIVKGVLTEVFGWRVVFNDYDMLYQYFRLLYHDKRSWAVQQSKQFLQGSQGQFQFNSMFESCKLTMLDFINVDRCFLALLRRQGSPLRAYCSIPYSFQLYFARGCVCFTYAAWIFLERLCRLYLVFNMSLQVLKSVAATQFFLIDFGSLRCMKLEIGVVQVDSWSGLIDRCLLDFHSSKYF